MFFIGSTDHKGTYFFHSAQHNGWVVADLDTGKASLHNRLATVEVKENSEAEDTLERRAGLGQDGGRWLVDGEELIPLLRDHGDEVEVLMIYYEDGSQKPYGRDEREVARFLRKSRKRLGEK